MKKILISTLLAASTIFAQAKTAAPAQPATATPVAAPVTQASKGKDTMGITVSAFGGLSLATARSSYSTELESAIKKSSGKSEATIGAPTGGAAVWYGNSQWQAGIGGSYVQVYKNVATIAGSSYTTTQTYIAAQALFRYFVRQGLYAGLGLGVGFGTLKVDGIASPASLKSKVVPVATLRLGYDYELPDLGVTVGGYADVSYFIATITDTLAGTSTDYNASDLVISPGVMVSYKF